MRWCPVAVLGRGFGWPGFWIEDEVRVEAKDYRTHCPAVLLRWQESSVTQHARAAWGPGFRRGTVLRLLIGQNSITPERLC